jgi:hypothetical protein
MSTYRFKDEAEFEAAVEASQTVTDLRTIVAKQYKDIADLTAKLASASSASISDDYAPFAAFPELQMLVKKSDMRPNSLSALVALEVWKSSADAKEFPHFVSAAAILPAIPAGRKGERDLVTVTRALENAAAAFLAANTGLGLKVDVTKGTTKRPASAKARIFRFRPVEEVTEGRDEDEAA